MSQTNPADVPSFEWRTWYEFALAEVHMLLFVPNRRKAPREHFAGCKMCQGRLNMFLSPGFVATSNYQLKVVAVAVQLATSRK
jgi:hypothetical protein